MSIAISNATTAPAVAQPTNTSSQRAAPAETQPAAGKDSVQLSKAAQAAAAVLQEVRETPSQTLQEAGKGDLQARRLLAREAAAQSVSK
jgi:hypothetical protein